TARSKSLLLPLDRAPADVAAAKAVGPANTVDCRIGAALSLAHSLGSRADVEYAAAIGEDSVAVRLRPGMEDLYPVDLRRRVKAFYDRTLVLASGIAFRRHPDRDRCIRIPAQFELLELSVQLRQPC